MKISYNWLNSLINTNLSVEKIGEILTDTGLEVEGIEVYNSIKGGLKGIVIGQVVTCVKHPNADKLSLTTVNVGKPKLLSIVCGAQNVADGQKVLVATVGTTIHLNDGNSFEIKKSKIRGEVSEGMICAEDEVGLGNGHDGILVLPDEFDIGKPADAYFKNYTDYLIDIGLTANRGDAASHLGVARDLKAVIGTPIQLSSFNLPQISGNKINVTVESPDCVRYSGIIISNVTVKPSPDWLQNYLKVIGIVPINNIVDVTNFVMHELGQPLHAFDASKLALNQIIVKQATAKQKFTTLDKVERALNGTECMICDGEKPIALAGIFGGLQSGINAQTTEIFIESATFNSASVRKTAKYHGLNTDASFRYERGTDVNITINALARAVELILQTAGGEISSQITDVYPKPLSASEVPFNLQKFTDLIGQKIELIDIKRILTALDFVILNETSETLLLQVPLYRTDVNRQADIAEEILRIYGLNNINIPQRITTIVSQSKDNELHALREKISAQLVAQGFNEMLNNSITKSTYYDANELENAVELLNPLSSDLNVMRLSMLYNGLEVLQYNRNRKASDMKLFEFGRTYHKKDNSYIEPNHLSLFMVGNQNPESWVEPAKQLTFYHLKDTITNLLKKAGIKQLQFTPTENTNLLYATDVLLKQKRVAIIGMINNALAKQFDLNEPVWYADVNWDEVCAQNQALSFITEAIPAFPAVRRDLALVLDKAITFDQIEKIARKCAPQLLQKINVFDVYKGDKIPSDKKSYAVSLVLQPQEKTFTDQEIEQIITQIVTSLNQQLGAVLRS